MKKLCTFHLWELPQAAMLKDFLTKEGIACLLRNEKLSSAVGEIPFVECFPELWVIDDECLPRARLLLDGWLRSGAESGEAWTCPGCGESCEAQFGACWACGKLRE